VYAPGYRRNASLARAWSYRLLAKRFAQQAALCRPPDLIVCGIPSLEWCHAAVAFGRDKGIPVFIDVRDRWPDIYLNVLPSYFRPLARAALHGVYRRTAAMLNEATALAAVSESYLSWALSLANRPRRPTDIVVPIGYDAEPLPVDEVGTARAALLQQGVDPRRTVAIFAGSFERSYDVATIAKAARLAQEQSKDALQFVICGDGGQMSVVRRLTAGLNNVVLLGWVNPTVLAAAMSLSHIGLAAYSKHALQSLPNKPFEYFAHSLAVVSSLQGEVAELLQLHDCGRTYRAGDAGHLLHQMCQLSEQPDRLGKYRDNGYKLWYNHFRCDVLYDEFATHLLAIAKAHSGQVIRTAA
jgi:glycosyltransferase involved in cell wall biosynthesis